MNYLLFWILFQTGIFHAFHVSVFDMEWESDEKHLKITTRVFYDDLEDALKLHTENTQYNISDESQWDSINKDIESYFLANFSIQTGRKPLQLVFLGSEREGDVIWSYIEVENLKSFKSMTITNSILTEVFDDQENLVHVRRNRVVRSLRLTSELSSGSLQWD